MYQCPVTTKINVNTTIKTFYPTLPTCIFLRAIDPLRRAACGMHVFIAAFPAMAMYGHRLASADALYPSDSVAHSSPAESTGRCDAMRHGNCRTAGQQPCHSRGVGLQSSASSVSHVRLPSVCGLRIRRSVSPTSAGYVASLVAPLRCDGSGACRVLTRGQRSFDCA
jgi:hypothetical protein